MYNLRRIINRNTTAPFAYKYGVEQADLIKEPIFQTGLSVHHAIYLGIDKQGIEWVAENQKFAGVRLVKAQDFFSSGQTYSVEKFSGSYEERVAAVKRALSQLGQQYDLVSYNCEHYSSYVRTGTSRSKQVENVVAGVGIFALFLFVGKLIGNTNK